MKPDDARDLAVKVLIERFILDRQKWYSNDPQNLSESASEGSFDEPSA